MFTGIIEALGRVSGIETRGGDTRLEVTSEQLDFSDVKLGDSIAVSGACLTVVELKGKAFAADVSNETLRCTSLGGLEAGDRVNLEKAMLPTTRFGGHMVSGHVDGLAELTAITSEGRSKVLTYRVPKALSRYIADKGSVCLDGVSLTVNSVNRDIFTVNIIPHTMDQTTMQNYVRGQHVNLEVDVVSRYLERLLAADESVEGLTMDTLKKAGMA